MKKQLSKKSLWRSILSILALGIFLFLAVGSIDEILTEMLGFTSSPKTEEDDGSISAFYAFTGNKNLIVKINCHYDNEGRWHGEVIITIGIGNTSNLTTITANYEHGYLHGISTTKSEGSTVVHDNYYMGRKIHNEKSAHNINTDNSGFNVLTAKYPWLLHYLNALDFDNEYIEAYMDTIETVLATYEFEDEDFDDYYDDVIEILEETPYDSIISVNLALSGIHGLELLKNFELRLAVLEHYRSGGNSTYNIMEATYPGILEALEEDEVSKQDFEAFCQDLDDSLTSYGPLDLEDPFFVDSVDSYMYKAIMGIYSAEKSSLSTIQFMKSAVQSSDYKDFGDLYSLVKYIHKPSLLKASSADIAEMVLYTILMDFLKGDILKQTVREAYLINKGVIFAPTVATVFSANNSATSATLEGYVFEDGGAAVTDWGIAWATFYNPTSDDNTETSGTGTGLFTVTLNGLTEGTTYYARSYATNSEGTAYGNCVEFVAAEPTDPGTGIQENQPDNQHFTIYPNPASAITTFNFQLEVSERIVLTIVDMKGRVIFKNDLGSLPQGENQIELYLSGLQNGMYTCRLMSNGTTKATGKLVIAH